MSDTRKLTWVAEFKQKGKNVLEDMNKEFGGMKKSLQTVGTDMQKVGGGMSKWLTVPLAGVGAASVKTVATFDDGMSRVKGLTGATGEEFDALRDKARELGRTTAFSATDGADGMQVLAASGMEVNDILATSEDMFTLMSAGATDADTAASILTNTMAQFNVDASESGRIIDTFAQGAASAKLGVDDLEYIMGQAGGTMASMNMDMEQSIAMAGQLANAGMPIGQVGTAINAMGREIKANSKDFEALGVNVYDSTGKMRDMGSIMGDLEGKLDGMSDGQRDAALSSVFSGQAMKGAIDWLSLGGDAYKELTDDMYGAEGAAEKFAQTNEDNIGGSIRALKSALEDAAIAIGDVLKGPLGSLAEKIKAATDKFNGLDDSTKENIVKFGLFAAALGPVLLIVGKVIGVMGKLGGAGRKITGVFKLVSGGAGTLGEGLGILTGPFGWVALAIGAVIGVGVLLYKNWDSIKEGAVALKESIVEVWTNIKEFFAETWNAIKENIVEVWTAIKEFFTELWTGLTEGIVETWTGIKEFFSELWISIGEGISNTWNAIKEFFANLWISIKETAVAGWHSFWEGIGNVITGIGEWIRNTWTAIVEWFSTLPGKLLQKGIDMFTSLRNGLASMVGAVKEKAREGGRGIIEAVKELPSKMLGIGRDIMKGIATGIKNGVMAPINAAKNAASRIGGAIKSKLRIASPSKLMIEYGQFTTQGLAVGMEDEFSTLDKASGRATGLIEGNYDGMNFRRLGGFNRGVTPAEEVVRKEDISTSNTTKLNTIEMQPQINITIEGNADSSTVGSIARETEEAVKQVLRREFTKLSLKGV